METVAGVKTRDTRLWKVTRDILDPRIGDYGIITMRVHAMTGPEALRFAEAKAFEMRETFIVSLGESGSQKWASWGWKNRDEFKKYLQGRYSGQRYELTQLTD